MSTHVFMDFKGFPCNILGWEGEFCQLNGHHCWFQFMQPNKQLELMKLLYNVRNAQGKIIMRSEKEKTCRVSSIPTFVNHLNPLAFSLELLTEGIRTHCHCPQKPIRRQERDGHFPISAEHEIIVKAWTIWCKDLFKVVYLTREPTGSS